jgi:hypothetical protein
VVRKGCVVIARDAEGNVTGGGIVSPYHPDCPVHGDEAQARARGGPAQVATEGYRRNWESIFGAKVPVGQA